MQIGIRAEDKNPWEARTALTPDHVKYLVDNKNIDFCIEPSQKRIFAESEYKQAGATISDTISDCPIIMGVKEIPVEKIEADKTYVFFSHTIKGQPDNMPALKRMMELGNTLIDYEMIKNAEGRRLVFFGRFAGLAGMIDTLWTLGRRYTAEGFNTPFNLIQQAMKYESLDEVKAEITAAGKLIEKQGLSKEIGPVVFGVTGYGNVSQGAQEILDCLPHQVIEAKDLESFMKAGEFSNKTIYKVVFKEENMVQPADAAQPFILQEYFTQPEKYVGIFEQYLPYLTVIVNCIYWDEKYPYLLTKDYLKTNFNKMPLKVVGDITCDIDGSIECNVKPSDPGNPVYVYHPETGETTDGVEGEGPIVLAVDNLPCELAKDASTVFGDALRDLVPALANAEFTEKFEDFKLIPELRNAMILYKGKLTPDFEYISKYLK